MKTPRPAATAWTPLKESLLQAWDIYRARMPTYIAIGTAGLLLMLTPLLLGTLLTLLTLKHGLLVLIPLFATGVGVLWAYSLTLVAFLTAISDEEAGLKASFIKSMPKALDLLLLNIAFGALAGGGYLLAVIPGVILTIGFFFAPFVLIAEDFYGMDALQRSWDYMRGRWGAVLWRLSVTWLSIPLIQVIPVIGQVAGILLSPLPFIHSFLIYKDVRDMHGNDPFVSDHKEKMRFLAVGIAGWILVPFLILTWALFFAMHRPQTPVENAPSVQAEIPAQEILPTPVPIEKEPIAVPVPPPALPKTSTAPAAISTSAALSSAAQAAAPQKATPGAKLTAPTIIGPTPEEALKESRALKLHARVKNIVNACDREIGLFCNDVKDNDWSAIRCLRRNQDVLLKKCGEALKDLRRPLDE